MSAEQLRREVSELPWYHRIDLGHGIVTPGETNTAATLAQLALPDDLRGRTVLDVGAWDGYYSFEAERRGAARVVAVDSFVWRGETWGSKRSFELARRALGSSVEDMEIEVLDLSAEHPGVFDLVLFLGVLYHMRHPLLALERVAEVTGSQLILETFVDLTRVRRPAAAFFPGDEMSGDETNWWGPNPAAVEGMLRAVGFRRVERISSRSRARIAWASGGLVRGVARELRSRRLRPALGRRAVFHAFK